MPTEKETLLMMAHRLEKCADHKDKSMFMFYFDEDIAKEKYVCPEVLGFRVNSDAYLYLFASVCSTLNNLLGTEEFGDLLMKAVIGHQIIKDREEEEAKREAKNATKH